MEAKNNKHSRKPRLVGGIIGEMLQGWHRNTELSVDLKTILRSDSKMKAGKNYQGILRRDEICEEFHYDEHFTFTETQPTIFHKVTNTIKNIPEFLKNL